MHIPRRAPLRRCPANGSERMTRNGSMILPRPGGPARTRASVPRFALTAALLCAVSIAAGQPSGQLEQQLQELKQQYAETTRALEQRIAALEQQIEKEKAAAATPKEGTVTPAELAK